MFLINLTLYTYLEFSFYFQNVEKQVSKWSTVYVYKILDLLNFHLETNSCFNSFLFIYICKNNENEFPHSLTVFIVISVFEIIQIFYTIQYLIIISLYYLIKIINLIRSILNFIFLQDMSKHIDRQEARKSMGFCLQDNVIFDSLTARDHLEVVARLRNIPADQRKKEV